MNKGTRKNNTYNIDIIRRLKEKYGLSGVFIYASLRGVRNSQTSIKICEDYKIMEKEINKTLQKI